MKTSNITFVVLLTIALAACRQHVAREQHQMESVSEFFDSIANRGISAQYILRCDRDTLYEEHIVTSARQHNAEQREIERHQFLIGKSTQLLENLCQKANESYRYTSGDSVNYSITLGKEPQELLQMYRWKTTERMEMFTFSHILLKPVKHMRLPGDIQSVQSFLKRFLAEQKGVKEYPVKYEWDQGVSMEETDGTNELFRTKFLGTDSLAASSVAGTHYFIPAKEEQRIRLATDFINRMKQLATEEPRQGLFFTTWVPFERFMRGDWYVNLMHYRLYDRGNRRGTCEILMGQSPKGIHILELYPADAPRLAIPHMWLKVRQTHNFDIVPEEDFKDIY